MLKDGAPRPGQELIHHKIGFRVIINDDFLEEGVCYERPLLPSIIYLGRLCIASRFISSPEPKTHKVSL